MGCNTIRIERDRNGFEVRLTDPAIQKSNEASSRSNGPSEWKDPDVEYQFKTKDQVLAFLDKAFDIALPQDEYSATFDKIAKEAQNDG